MKKKFLFDFFPELEDNKDLPLNLRNAQIPEGVHFKVLFCRTCSTRNSVKKQIDKNFICQHETKN